MTSRLLIGALAVAWAAACAKTTMGTETGNPPVIATNLIGVVAIDEDVVRVSGEAGAISPGGGEVSITNTSRDGEPVVVDVAEDGSFSAELPGSPDDTYEVVATGAGGSSSTRTVGSAGPSPADWQVLHVCEEADPSDAIEVHALRIEADTLHVDVSHGGGCEQHRYGLCYGGAWRESFPVQIGLRVLHDDGGDTCNAVLYESLSFDLTPLKQAYAAMYGEGPGAASLGFDGCVMMDQPPDRCEVLYEWGDPERPCGPPITSGCPPFEIPEAPATWVLHPTRCGLSFRGPDNLLDVDPQFSDSCADYFENQYCSVDVLADSTVITSIEEVAEDVVVGRAAIQGVDAKIITGKLVNAYLAGAYFPQLPSATSSGATADLLIQCGTPEHRDAMIAALGTVEFD